MQFIYARSWEGFSNDFPFKRLAPLEGDELERAIATYARAYLAEHPNMPTPPGIDLSSLDQSKESDALAKYLCPTVGVRVSPQVFICAAPSIFDTHTLLNSLETFARSRGFSGLGIRFGSISDRKLTPRAEQAIHGQLTGTLQRPLVTSAFAASIEPLEAHAHHTVWGVTVPPTEIPFGAVA